MDRDEYKKMKEAARKLAPFYHPSSSIIDPDKHPDYRDKMGGAVYTLREMIQEHRSELKHGVEKAPPLIKIGGRLTHAMTQSRVSRIINGILGSSKTDVQVTIGLIPTGYKTKREDRSRYASGPLIAITVGHMWERKVWREFYSNKNLDTDWFVLAATEVRVNRKNQFRLFEARLFQPSTNINKDGYIIKSTIGEKTAAVANTASQAVELGYAMISEELKKRINKENDI